jgi:hypothetical protein
MEKYPVRAIYSGIHLAETYRKIAKGDEMNL